MRVLGGKLAWLELGLGLGLGFRVGLGLGLGLGLGSNPILNPNPNPNPNPSQVTWRVLAAAAEAVAGVSCALLLHAGLQPAVSRAVGTCGWGSG